MRILVDDLTSPQTQALIDYHQRSMHAASPPGTSYALSLSGLQGPDVTVWTAWRGSAILGCAALKQLGPESGEIKSMRAAPGSVRTGVGEALLLHLIGEARARGYKRLSLETGSGPAFAAAIGLYRKHGFEPGAAFSDYAPSDFNQFFHLDL
jgi:putative acetyltransferase